MNDFKSIFKTKAKALVRKLPKSQVQMQSALVEKTINVLVAIVILIVGHVIGMWISNSVKRAMLKQRIRNDANTSKQPTVAEHVVGVILYGIVILVSVVIVLRYLGVETTSIVAIIGSIGFALGLALQGGLSDLAAGILLSIGADFAVGDMIAVADSSGRVHKFNLLYTTLEAENTYHLVKVPNRLIYGNVMHNHTRPALRSVLVELVVSNRNANLDRVLKELEAALSRDPRVRDDKLPVKALVSEVREYGTVITVRVHMNSKDYPNDGNMSVENDFMTISRRVLVENGIELVDFVRTRQ